MLTVEENGEDTNIERERMLPGELMPDTKRYTLLKLLMIIIRSIHFE